MNKIAIAANGLAPPVGPFSPAIRSDPLVYFSGQIALDNAGKLVAGDAAKQAEQIFSNIRILLEAARRSFASRARTSRR